MEYFSYPQYRQGVVVGAVVTFIDITARKESEKLLIVAKEAAEAAKYCKKSVPCKYVS